MITLQNITKHDAIEPGTVMVAYYLFDMRIFLYEKTVELDLGSGLQTYFKSWFGQYFYTPEDCHIVHGLRNVELAYLHRRNCFPSHEYGRETRTESAKFCGTSLATMNKRYNEIRNLLNIQK